MKQSLSEEAAFLLETNQLNITGNPPELEKIKKRLEEEIGRIVNLTITKQEGNHIEATFSL